MHKGAQHWRNSQRRKEIERIDRKKAMNDIHEYLDASVDDWYKSWYICPVDYILSR